MSAMTNSIAQAPEAWTLPYRGKVGMAGLIIAESAIFTIFVVAYLFYTGKSLTGPTPREVLNPPIFYSIWQLDDSFRCETSETAAVCSLPHFVGSNSRAR